MRFIDFFAGVGGFRRGLELSGHRCVGFCEWDKYATGSYTSMHLITDEQRKTLESMTLRQRQKEILKDEYRNGEWYASDIMGVDAGSLPDADCWTFGAPCQDFSIAGKRKGLEGDRSSLVGQIFRLLEEIGEDPKGKNKSKPEWLIYENVTGMFSTNSGIDYLQILSEMDKLGYDIQWQNLHTEWYLPQHRERIYTVGHLRGRGRAEIFPITGTDGENSVRQIASQYCDTRKNPQRMRTYEIDGIAPCLNCMEGRNLEPHVAIKVIGTTQPHRHSTGDIHDISGISPTILSRDAKQMKQVAIPVITPDRENKRQNGRRFKENGELMFTLTARDRHGVAIEPIIMSGNQVTESENICRCLNANDQRKVFGAKQERTMTSYRFKQERGKDGIYIEMPGGFLAYCVWYEKYQCYIAIRKLTPKECFRLQGWSDEYFERAALVNSDSQLYKQAGNGVSVPVVKAIGDKIAEFERKRFEQCVNKPESEEL